MNNIKSLILSLIAVTSMAACTQIDTGNVGVERAFGKVTPLVQVN